MSEFSDAVSSINAAELEVFGDPVIYTPAASAPIQIIAIRGSRTAEENEQLAAFERIWTTTKQFASTVDPQKGDAVTIGGSDYLVHTAKPDADPASDGMTIYLNRTAR